MHLLILGGTGAIGVLLVREALAADHTVTIYARTPSKLPADLATHPAVTVVEGTLEDAAALSAAVKGAHAVVSALGPALTGHPPGTPLAHAYARVLAAMKVHDVKRLVALGTASIRDPHDKSTLRWESLIKGVQLTAPNAYADIVAVGDTIRGDADVVWTIVRVPILSNGLSREVVAGYTGDGKTGYTLARVGFGVFVVGELERNEWVKKAPLISTE
ncbi:hypothetical protein PLICRDRAFT_700446 [Plicaturopsis crispa FD-325 SS-3]|nr:hypothetical protein PLICRDRAFT_700446 [Plicaturopsis crispa FD-325 SS-3]